MIEFQPNRVETPSDRPEFGQEKSLATKKKKKLGSSVAREVVIPPPEVADPEKAKSLWQRLAAIAEKKEIDKQFLRPVEQADNDSKLAMPDIEKDGDAGETEAPLESLGGTEKREAVRRYTESRLDALQAEAPAAVAGTPVPAETAADRAYLAYVEKQLMDDPDLDIEELLNAAEVATREQMDEASGRTDDSEETLPETAHEGEIDLHGDAAPEDDAHVVIPLGGGSGGNTPPPPPIPPTGGAASGGPAGGGPGGRGPGSTPPPFYGGMPPSGAPVPGYYNIPSSPDDMVSKEEAYAYERQAMARGFVVGGIIGYLIGRRRGRIKTEKRLLPIQKKLEKEVVSLHDLVFEKEQAIRNAAAEKTRLLRTGEEKQQFSERLLRAEESVRKTLDKQPKPQATKIPRAELGRVLVEAPASTVMRAAASGREAGQESVRASLVPRRKVDTYTTAELKTAAAKIRVEGVTLKQLWDSDRLDEPALRRVMTEFIEGGSIHAALNQELLDRELRVEKDPKLRDVLTGQKNDMAAIAGAALLSHEKQDQVHAGEPHADKPKKSASNSSKSPGDKAKKQEKLELVGGLVVLGIIIVLILIYM